MTPDAVYVFEQVPEAQTRYRLISHSGKSVPNFPAYWKRGDRAGQAYVIFRRYEDQRPGHGGAKFGYALTLDGNRLVSGFNFTAEDPCRAFGDYGRDAILIFFSPDFKRLEVQCYENMKHRAEVIFRGDMGSPNNKPPPGTNSDPPLENAYA